MKLLESYALNCGAKIDKPFINTAFFPLPFENYITIHASSGMPSKDYDYWEEVLDMVIDKLKEKKINIVQIGGPKDKPLKYCYYLQGKTNLHQTAYILANSKLHLSNDTFSAHIVGSFGLPLISLYGATTVANHSPYFKNNNVTILMESDRKGKLPSYAKQEKPKSINLIKPEEVACNVFKLLNVDKGIDIESVYIGEHYLDEIVEYVPNAPFPQEFQGGLINIRMDYHFDKKNMSQLLSQRKCCILADKPIDTKLIRTFKNNISLVSYEISKETNLNYIQELKSTGVKLQLVSPPPATEKDESDLKLKFFDFDIDIDKKNNKIKKQLKEKMNNAHYKSHKFILSKGKIYLSKADYILDNSVENLINNTSSVPDLEDFFNEIDHFYIFNKTN